MNQSLRVILKPAYDPCRGFSGTCVSMRWYPEFGHVPRGFYGALGDLSKVRLVMVLAEPSDSGGDEIHAMGLHKGPSVQLRPLMNDLTPGLP